MAFEYAQRITVLCSSLIIGPICGAFGAPLVLKFKVVKSLNCQKYFLLQKLFLVESVIIWL